MDPTNLIEKSPTEELFLLRLLTSYTIHHGLPLNIPTDIRMLGQDPGPGSLYNFIRTLIHYSQKQDEPRHTNNIVKRLAALPINSNTVDTIFNDLIDISVSSVPVRRELVFSILAREIDPDITVDPDIQNYLQYVSSR